MLDIKDVENIVNKRVEELFTDLVRKLCALFPGKEYELLKTATCTPVSGFDSVAEEVWNTRTSSTFADPDFYPRGFRRNDMEPATSIAVDDYNQIKMSQNVAISSFDEVAGYESDRDFTFSNTQYIPEPSELKDVDLFVKGQTEAWNDEEHEEFMTHLDEFIDENDKFLAGFNKDQTLAEVKSDLENNTFVIVPIHATVSTPNPFEKVLEKVHTVPTNLSKLRLQVIAGVKKIDRYTRIIEGTDLTEADLYALMKKEGKNLTSF